MTRIRICAVTGTRAEYGWLHPLLRKLATHPAFELLVVATAAHLSTRFGLTVRTIAEDGFTIAKRVEVEPDDDTPTGVARSMGLGAIGFGRAFAELKPDAVIVLGDRFELLAVAQAALVARIPLVHLSGGDVTEGAFDDAIRHAITKMSHLHFVTNELAHRRVIQLGEHPDTVFNVGSTALDDLLNTPLPTREELERSLDFTFRGRNLLVTYHPVTLGVESARSDMTALLTALESYGSDIGLIFTLPNADPGNGTIRELIDAYIARHPENAKAFTSLGQLRYWGTARTVDAVVGNSSSGLFEIPSLGTATVNIGDRQKGRLTASSVITCESTTGAIRAAIDRAFTLDTSNVVNPYGDGNSASRIVEILEHVPDFSALVRKRFYDLPSG